MQGALLVLEHLMLPCYVRDQRRLCRWKASPSGPVVGVSGCGSPTADRPAA